MTWTLHPGRFEPTIFCSGGERDGHYATSMFHTASALLSTLIKANLEVEPLYIVGGVSGWPDEFLKTSSNYCSQNHFFAKLNT
jgi:hypothetical protein